MIILIRIKKLKNILKEIETTNKKHIIACNEAHAVGIAFGAILAGANPCVYLQNSGLGMALATKHFANLPMTPAPCALSAILHCLIGSFLATKWRLDNQKSEK